MSATNVGDADAAEVEISAVCHCCGLTEDCTPAYVAGVRARYGGLWVCGLCGEAVEDEIRRGPMAAEEAISRHAAFLRTFRSSLPPAASGPSEHLIAAVLQLLRRGLDRSAPGSPVKKSAGMAAAHGPSLALSGAC